MNDLLKEKALKFILYKMRSEKEVRQYLSTKEASLEEIDEIITYLYHYHYLDDLQYAEAYARDKLRFNPIGKIKLRYELSLKGVSSSIIEEVLSEVLDDETEAEIALNVLVKKRRINDDLYKKHRYLYTRGFSNSAIDKAINKSEMLSQEEGFE